MDLIKRSNIKYIPIYRRGNRFQNEEPSDSTHPSTWDPRYPYRYPINPQNTTYTQQTTQKKQPIFGNTIDYDKFVQVMYPKFETQLKNIGLSGKNLEKAIDYTLRVSAVESGYGTQPRGYFEGQNFGYNMGGIKWSDKRHSKYGKHKVRENEVYVVYPTLDDYVRDQVSVLNGTYNAYRANDVYQFINLLHQGPNGLNYSIKENYLKVLPNMNQLEKAINRFKSNRK